MQIRPLVLANLNSFQDLLGRKHRGRFKICRRGKKKYFFERCGGFEAIKYKARETTAKIRMSDGLIRVVGILKNH